ncbi:outer membrane beta-barrel protein [Marivirga sp.]|uniref:outer membrane beta-barrel protein n=1 Tax=Marivirga sp. TaxID=2018662 RepID=UPI0025FF165A|nr:outer membrane beta-barrel protein [Marivirga sp.]
MKKLFLLALVAVSINFANAQDYKPFQLYSGVGYAIPQGGGGILFDIEPAYRINDQISVGLRWEVAAMARVVGNQEASVSGTSSYTLNGKYYLENGSSFRPYVGAGLGAYGLASVSTGTNGAAAGAETKIGFYPRIGFDWGHFNINIDYNFIPSSEIQGTDTNGNPATFDVANSYLGIRIGAFLFGGKK